LNLNNKPWNVNSNIGSRGVCALHAKIFQTVVVTATAAVFLEMRNRLLIPAEILFKVNPAKNLDCWPGSKY
jgi:hypothetical protein